MYELVGKPCRRTTAGACGIAGLAEEQPVTVDGQVAMMNSRHE